MPQSPEDIKMYGDRSGANAANAKIQAAEAAFAAANSKGQATPADYAARAAAQAEFNGTPLASGTANPQDAGLTQGAAALRADKGATLTADNRGLGNFTGITNPNATGVAVTPTLANGQQAGSSQTGLQIPKGQEGYVFDPTTGTQVSPAEAALNAQKASGQKAPQDSSSGVAGANAGIDTVNKNNPPPYNSAQADVILADNKAHQQYLTDYAASQTSQANTESLVAEYTRLQNEKGLPALNAQLLNMKTIMDGTEQDIRNEITKAGGFATNSQVLALASARNKTMQLNYNNLLQTRDDAIKNIDTIMGLSKEDRAYAKQQIDSQLNFDQKQIDFADKAVTNANDVYQKMVTKDGYAGLLASANGDPHAVSLIESTMGLNPGGLAALAQVEANAAAAKAGTSATGIVGEYQDALRLGLIPKGTSLNQFVNDRKPNTTTNNTTINQAQSETNKQIDDFHAKAADYIQKMDETDATKHMTWDTAWASLHAQFPQASTELIDQTLQADKYRDKNH